MVAFEFETVTVDDHGNITCREIRQAKQFTETLDKGMLLEMVLIPGGIFRMGSPRQVGYDDERPQHPVSIAPFSIGKYPITQEQWQAVMGKPPLSRFPGRKHPVERVSWVDAQNFCRRLSKRTGRAYRLPGEAEWEYACRAHTATPFYCGQTLTTELANYCGDHVFAKEPTGIYRHTTTEVGSFPPNNFGVYDMHGNLWEWCADAWHDQYEGAPADGAPWESRKTEYRVVRGGSWHETPNHCRSAVRLKFNPSDRDEYVGFRVALSLPPEKANL